MSDNVIGKKLKDCSIGQILGLIIVFSLLMTTLIDFKNVANYLKNIQNKREGYRNYLDSELSNYRSPNVEGTQNQADTIGKYKNYYWTNI